MSDTPEEKAWSAEIERLDQEFDAIFNQENRTPVKKLAASRTRQRRPGFETRSSRSTQKAIAANIRSGTVAEKGHGFLAQEAKTRQPLSTRLPAQRG